MRYHDITKDDMKNGDGLRVVLWVAGCAHHCRDCQNPVTWDPEDGAEFGEAAWQEIAAQLEKSYISGLTFSGGDPLYPDNRETVTKLAARVRKEFPDKTIWLYTGYRWEEVRSLPVFANVDVCVDGRFAAEQKDTKLLWKGSKNQRVIDVKKTRMAGADAEVILHCGDYETDEEL